MQEPIFHTVHEAARILRVDAATIYRSIRAGSFPAIRIRSRYVIPAAALREVAAKAVSSGTCVDLTDSTASAVVRPPTSMSIDAVARDMRTGRTLRHARAQDLGRLAIGRCDPCRIHAEGRRPAATVSEPPSHGA